MAKGHLINDGYKPGDNWNSCDRCGFERRVSEMKTEWNGSEVCADTCYETRHPQDFIRTRQDTIIPGQVGTQDGTDNTVGATYDTMQGPGIPTGTNDGSL